MVFKGLWYVRVRERRKEAISRSEGAKDHGRLGQLRPGHQDPVQRTCAAKCSRWAATASERRILALLAQLLKHRSVQGLSLSSRWAFLHCVVKEICSRV